MSELVVGSTWRENDKRFERIIRVTGVNVDKLGRVAIQTVSAGDGRDVSKRTTYADPAAFGRRYKLHQPA